MVDPPVLSIEGLRTYFHTYEGVVKAVEGIDLEIPSGETVGLVGETGCGKSVTALSVLRLVPIPPGRIEGGRVFLSEPADVRSLRREYDSIAFQRLSRKGTTGPPTAAQLREALEPEIIALQANLSTARTDRERAEAQARLQAATSEFDLLQKPEEAMRDIRGNLISMIFQEPMSALNPVFTVGFQIAESVLLHRREEVCRAVLQTLDREIAASEGRIRGRRVTPREALSRLLEATGDSEELRDRAERVRDMTPDEEVCGHCFSRAPDLWDYCPSCGARLAFDALRPVRRWILKQERKLYRRMLRDPNDQLVDFLGTVPLLRRLVRNHLQGEGIRRAVGLIREVNIPEPEAIARRYPFELSGGMRQRSMIAMMIACNPRLLIADEPTTALDVTVEAQILKLMKELQAKTNMAILLITHDLGIVAEQCDRVGVMYAGAIAEFGRTQEIFHRTRHPYTSALMKSIPRFRGQATGERKRGLYVIKGTVPNLLHPPPGCRFHPRCPRALEVCSVVDPKLEEIEPGHLVACHNPVPLEELPA